MNSIERPVLIAKNRGNPIEVGEIDSVDWTEQIVQTTNGSIKFRSLKYYSIRDPTGETHTQTRGYLRKNYPNK